MRPSNVDETQGGTVGESTSSSTPPKETGSVEWNTEQLFGTAQEVSIRHADLLYRLRRTKQGKLILTK